MNDWNFKQEDIINASDRFRPPPKSLEPPIDNIVSGIVGKKVYQSDPNLIKLVMKHKSNNPDVPDNLFANQKFIRELKQTFNSPL